MELPCGTSSSVRKRSFPQPGKSLYIPSLLQSLRSRFGVQRNALPEIVFSAIVARAQEGILIADIRSSDAQIVFVNRAFEKITGYTRMEVVGKNCRYLQGSDRLQPEIETIRKALSSGVATRVQLRNYRKDGALFWNDLHLVPIGGVPGAPTHYVGFLRDVTEAVTTAVKLDQMLRTDNLTGCLNRDAFVEHLSSRTASSRMLLIKLDIARFHEINSGYGFDVGDALLKASAQRLSSLAADLVARIGNDQFALAFSLDNDVEVPAVLGRMTHSLEPRFVLPGADLKIRFGVGFVVGSPGADAMTLVRQAGAALAESKASRLRYPCEFSAGRQAEAHRRLQMTAELQRGLSSNAFIYHYQPQVDLITDDIVGAEALVRWKHPLFGLQQPKGFIEVAEETGIILDIGASGLRDVAQFAVSHNRRRTTPICFSFNVSAIEFTHRDMVPFVRRVIEESGADPAWLTLELTESLLADDSPELLRIFHGLRDLGVGLSIDDFGTGYSSLRYLERFPLTEIKIDRSFVSGMTNSAAKRVIVEAVIKLGSKLGVRVIGEGVEQQTEREMLVEMGCTLAQGYLFSPPLGADEFRQLAG
jgi:PAS domain S-box-containing protein/diguanylate cyclase (GGDEF)-like protein